MNRAVPRVSDYMTANPHFIGLHHSLAEAYALMRQHDIRHLPVLAGEKLVGLLTESDSRTMDLLRRLDLAQITVEEAMKPVPFAVTADARLDEVAREMAAMKCDAAVVLRDARLIGVFTATDALRALVNVLAGGAKK